MKNLKYTIGLLLLILLNGNLFGQTIDLNESEVYFEGKKTMALAITLPLDDGDLRREWADYLDANFEIDLDMVKRKKDTTVFISEEVINNNLSDTSYAIYSKIVEESNGESTLYTFWATNKNGLLDKGKHKDKVKKSKIIMLDFAEKVYVEFYEKQITAFKAEQQTLMKKHDKLERRNEQLTKRNNRYREKTKNREKRINLNEEQKDRNKLEMRKLILLHEKLNGKINVLNYEIKIISE